VRRAITVMLSVAWSLCLAAPAIAEVAVIDVAELLRDPAAYAAPDVAEVRLRGELVGDFGHRQDAVWTQLNQDSYSAAPILSGGPLAGGNQGIAVRIPLAIWHEAGPPGGYRHRGAIVEVAGAWRYHDPDRSGESYLDATSFRILEQSAPLHEQFPRLRLLVGWVLLVGAGLIAGTRGHRAGD